MRNTFTCKGSGVDFGGAIKNKAIRRNASAWFNSDGIANFKIFNKNAFFITRGIEPPASARKKFEHSPQGFLSAIKSNAFQAFTNKANEDNFCSNEGFPN